MEKAIYAVQKLSDSLKEHTKSYRNSRVLATSFDHKGLGFDYTFRDILLSAAITDSSVLFIGGTDLAKTSLACMTMRGLFGEENIRWHRLQLNATFGKESFTEIDFSAITQGKSSTELVRGLKFLSLPGLILDEPNRAPAKITNPVLHIIDRDLTLDFGQQVKVGHEFGGKTYQFLISCMNVGEEYEGVFEIDAAMSRRMVVKIPMDNFYPDLADIDELLREETSISANSYKPQEHLDEVLTAYEAIHAIPVKEEAHNLMVYLLCMNACARSVTGSKVGIEFSEHICSQPGIGNSQDGKCHCYDAAKNICPNVQAFTPGVMMKARDFAKGIALVRAAKLQTLIQSQYVELGDGSLNRTIREYLDLDDSLDEPASQYEREVLGAQFMEAYSQNLAVEIHDLMAALPFVG
jgi:hypothetical protein